MSKEIDEIKENLASFIGEGIHAGLRKWCESPQSNQAWQAIKDMPDEEWNGIVENVATLILGLDKDSPPQVETDTLRIAIVRKKAEYPKGVFDYKQHQRIFEEAQFTKDNLSDSVIREDERTKTLKEVGEWLEKNTQVSKTQNLKGEEVACYYGIYPWTFERFVEALKRGEALTTR